MRKRSRVVCILERKEEDTNHLFPAATLKTYTQGMFRIGYDKATEELLAFDSVGD